MGNTAGAVKAHEIQNAEEAELTEFKDNNHPPVSTLVGHGCMFKQPISMSRDIRVGRWKERYFILKRGALFYYSVTSTMSCSVTADTRVELGPFQFTLAAESGHVVRVGHTTFAVPIKEHARKWVDILKHRAQPFHGAVYFLAYPNTQWETWCVRHLDFQPAPSETEESVLVIRELSQLGHVSLARARVEECASSSPEGHGDNGISGTSKCIFHVATESKILTLRCASPQLCDAWKMSITQALDHPTPACPVSDQDATMLEFFNTLHDVMENAAGGADVVGTRRASSPSRRKPFFVLSIDGGGTRGIIPCIVLERIVKHIPHFLGRVDMLAGTSNGALLAMALAFGHYPATIREMMLLTSRAVFGEKQGHYSVSSAKWSNRALALFCQEVWQDQTLADAHVPCLVPAFLLDNQRASPERDMETRVFTSATHGSEKVRDVLMRTCAAPIYFPAWQSYVDGGVFAHNPADLAVAHALAQLNVPLEDVVVLSLSTGHVRQYMADDAHNYGYYQWATQLPTVLWRGMIDKTTTLCRALLGDRFNRIDPELEQELALDEPTLFPAMITCAEEENLDRVVEWIKEKLY
uniref:PNPLA domain-containing protein n=1 Tax=viral metagenome TaxID=1070528 RepID=A0A6C0BLX6_9ZZZZ